MASPISPNWRRAKSWRSTTLRVERGRLDDVFRAVPLRRWSPPRSPTRPNPRCATSLTIFHRELASYFATPLAYVFIVIFLVLAGVLTFFVGDFFERGQADLQSFFAFHPWLYLVLIPALSMRLWAEERKSGTIELFLTLPIRSGRRWLASFSPPGVLPGSRWR